MTVDGGKSWKQIRNAGASTDSLNPLLAGSAGPRIIYVGGVNGLFRCNLSRQ
jgi:hypothetical protein